MFLKGTGIQGSPILIKALFLIFILFIALNEAFSEELQKKNESEEFVIPSDKISRSKVIEVSKQCLERSTHKNEYFLNKFKVHYDDGAHMWGVEFKKKSSGEDMCMYGVTIEKDTGTVACQCLYGL